MKLIKVTIVISIQVAGALIAIDKLALPERTGQKDIGLERTNCWFDKKLWEVFTFCYYMNVPEDHQQPAGRQIRFPVVYFKTTNVLSNKAPVLHLGGGGPGGPMYLDSHEGVKNIKEEHDDFSLKKDRDLVVIDVRGTGLAKPSLACHHFVKLQLNILEQNLSFAEEFALDEASILKCINEYKSRGIGLTHYNSASIAKDIDLLRKSLGTKQLVLFGVSYGAVYAQEMARSKPEVVESMILDSAAFPHISLDEDLVKKTLAPYRSLYTHCAINRSCNITINNTKKRIWTIYRQLKLHPIEMTIENHNTGENLTALLNGNRFIASLINASYSMDIYDDLALIIDQLEQGNTQTMEPYFADYATYMLDPQWGDVNARAHYCYETKPFIDLKKLRSSIDRLPSGYIRDSALLSTESNDFCKEMDVSAAKESFGEEQPINVPTLFLQGRYDSITPLFDVENSKRLFPNSRLLTYQTAHSVMTANQCAEISAGKFVANPNAQDLSC